MTLFVKYIQLCFTVRNHQGTYSSTHTKYSILNYQNYLLKTNKLISQFDKLL